MIKPEIAFEVSIDRARCVGSGNCVLHAEGVFDQDEEGFAVVADLSAQPEDVIEFTASSCPMNAISFVRKTGKVGREA